MTTIEDLVEQHARATREQERALIEYSIWCCADALARQEDGFRSFMHKHLPSVSINQIELRFTLYNAGAQISVLWERVDGLEGMPLVTAANRLRAARQYDNLAEGLKIVLDEYDQWPWSSTVNGGRFRRRPMSQIARSRLSAERTGKPRGKQARRALNENSVRRFWATLREQVVSFYEGRLTGFDPIVANKLQREFCVDLQALCEEHGNKIDRARRNVAGATEVDTAVKFIRVREACEILAIDPPVRGAPLDLAKANKRKRQLARQYHPDVAGESLRSQYHTVLDAYTTLKTYMEQISTSKAITVAN